MVNILDLTKGKKKFEVNKSNAKKFGITFDKELLWHGGAEPELERLYKKLEKERFARRNFFRENLLDSQDNSIDSLDIFNFEFYDKINSNRFVNTITDPLSTFSFDVDRSAYANIRRFLLRSKLPPVDVVRIEEMVNYFNYDYPKPEGGHPFSVNLELAQCPWEKKHQLIYIGIKGKEVDCRGFPPNNIVFLINASSSMGAENKLPLLKKAFKILIEKMRAFDKVAIVTYYSRSSSVALSSTFCNYKSIIFNVLNILKAEGPEACKLGC